MARSMPTGSNGTSIYGSGRKDTPLCECHNSLNKDLIPYEDAVCPSGTGEGAGAPVMRNTCPISISRHSHFRCPGCTHAQHSCPGARAMAQKKCFFPQYSVPAMTPFKMQKVAGPSHGSLIQLFSTPVTKSKKKCRPP